MKWYYAVGKEKNGPLSGEDIQKLAAEGTITPDTYVWHEGLTEWVRYRSIEQNDTKREGQVACSECGNLFAEDEVISYGNSRICASCKPAFFQKVREGVQLPASLRYAGFWIRFGAKFIDNMILSAANMVLSLAMGIFMPAVSSAATSPESISSGSIVLLIIVTVLQLAIPIFYTTYFVGKYAATPGKMACGLKIVTPEGEQVGYGRAFGRYFAEILSAITLMIGYIMAAFDDEKRALHDRVCSTRVIHK